MKSYSISEYIEAGCEEMDGIMMAVHKATTGKVCDSGCAVFNEGTCHAYRKLILLDRLGKSPVKQQETVKQEATKRGISISEVRRQRRNTKA